MKIKKWLAILLALVMLLGLAACGSEEADDKKTAKSDKETSDKTDKETDQESNEETPDDEDADMVTVYLLEEGKAIFDMYETKLF